MIEKLFEVMGDLIILAFKPIALMLITPITLSIESMFTYFEEQVTMLSSLVSQTPMEYNTTIFNFIETVQEKAVLPIAIVIMTLVMCHELITMVIDKNNMADFPVSDFLKWIFKTAIAILFLDKSFEFVCAVFELARAVVMQSGGVLSATMDWGFGDVVADSVASLTDEENVFTLIFIFLGVWLLRFVMIIAGLIINFVVVLRMIEIYMMISLAPIPFATLGNREFGQIGQNYIKSIFALAFQSFFMFLALAMFGVLLSEFTIPDGDVILQLTTATGYAILLCFTFGKVGSYSNRVFGTS